MIIIQRQKGMILKDNVKINLRPNLKTMNRVFKFGLWSMIKSSLELQKSDSLLPFAFYPSYILCCNLKIKLYIEFKAISITFTTIVFLLSAYTSFVTKCYSCIVYLCFPPSLEVCVGELFSPLAAFLPNTWGLTPSKVKL